MKLVAAGRHPVRGDGIGRAPHRMVIGAQVRLGALTSGRANAVPASSPRDHKVRLPY
jgi:hypothetical protein